MNLTTYKDGYVKSDIKLSIGMLVSNHIQYIEKCMEGLRPLLEAVPSELVILDTVGPEKTDGSIDICRKYTDKIYRFDWVNDFSAARNELLSHCSGEWFMYQDDDEWFEDVEEFIRFFKSDDIHKYNSGFYLTRDYCSDGSFSVGIAGRMIRRRLDSHFEGKVHECFNEANIPGKQFTCFTNHMGYMYETAEDRLRKSQRNLTLLEEEIKEKGINPGRCAQKVQELLAIESMQEEGYKCAVEYADKLVEKGQAASNCTQWIICARARYFLIKKNGEALVDEIRFIRSNYKLSHFAMLVLSEIEVDGITHYCDTSKYLELIVEDVRRYAEIESYFMKHPDEQLLETQLDFPRFFTKERKNAMYLAGVQAENFSSDYEKALEYLKKIDWSEVENPERYKENILNTLQNLEDPKELCNYYKTFMNPALFDEGMEKYLPKDLRDKLSGCRR